MIKLTQSLEQFMWQYYREKLTLLTFGHTEELTPEIWNEYIEWCKTDEGEQYLRGGSKYKEDNT